MAFAKVNDIELYYEFIDSTEYWEAPKLPLLLIHGMGVDHTIWLHMLPILSLHFPIISVDCRGHGRSSRPSTGYEMETFAADMAELLKSLNVNRANVLGTSMGGIIAQILAINHPELVHSMILFGTFCSPPKEVNLEERFKVLAEADDLEPLYTKVVERALPSDVGPSISRLIIDLEIHNHPREFITEVTRATFTYSGCEVARKISCKTLILAGEFDGSVPPYCQEELHENISDSAYRCLPKVGHTPYLENPKMFGDVILEFLKTV